jgi:hypothetical protein
VGDVARPAGASSITLAVPVVTIFVFNQPDMMKRVIEAREYIVYPPEGPKPPIGNKKDIEDALKALRERPSESK